MDFDPPKRYTEYLDAFVKKYTPPKPEEKKTEVKAEEKKPAKTPAKKPDKKPADNKPQAAAGSAETIIPDENAGIPKIPLNPEGDFQEWLKTNQTEESPVESADAAEPKETVAEPKETAEGKSDEAKPDTEPEKEQPPAPAPAEE